MLQIIIKDIKRPYLLDDEEYAWILEHLNVPLNVQSLSFCTATGELYAVTVVTDDKDLSVITLFYRLEYPFSCVMSNDITYEFIGDFCRSNVEVTA
jgi:hypothetical protein